MKVIIEKLTFETIIGILPHERVHPQQVVVDCSFKYHYTKGQFVNYAQVANDIKMHLKEKKFELLEEAIIFLRKHLKKDYPIKKIKLKIAKPTVLEDCIVSVENS